MKALVIFSSANTHWLSGLLHRDTRHVWCATYDDRTRIWIEYDMGAFGKEMRVLCDGDFDPINYYESEGYEVYPLDIDDTRRSIELPFTLNNCVGMVKTLLGLETPAFTPRQLRSHVRSLPVGDAKCASYALT